MINYSSNYSSSIVLLTWNGISYLQNCLDSLFQQTLKPGEIIVVDNGSVDGSADFIETNYPTVKLIRNKTNLGVSIGWNQALKVTQKEIIILVNQDMTFRVDWLEQMQGVFQRNPEVAIVGCKLLYPDNSTIQHAGGKLSFPSMIGSHYGYNEIDKGQYDEEVIVDFVTGAAMAIRQETFDLIGTFDESFSPAYYEDVDFCLRAKKQGLKILYSPNPVAIHYESTSLGGNSSEKLFYLLHKNRILLAFKHLQMEEIKEAFIPAELEYLYSNRPSYMINPLKQLYRDGFELNFLTNHPLLPTLYETLKNSL